MKKEDIELLLNAACESLYRNEYELVKNQTHERTLAGSIFYYLRKPFQDAGWDVDLEYNREGEGGDPKHDETGNMIPDIIVHNRESIEGPNLVAIELKGFWNPADRSLDQNKLRRMRAKYGYKYLYQVEFNLDSWVLTEVASRKERRLS